MTNTANTFPRNCEMGNGMIRLGYSCIERAHDAAIAEQRFRDGQISESEFASLTTDIELKSYSAW